MESDSRSTGTAGFAADFASFEESSQRYLIL